MQLDLQMELKAIQATKDELLRANKGERTESKAGTVPNQPARDSTVCAARGSGRNMLT